MKCMNVMQYKSQKNKENKIAKKNGHKEQRDKAQGLCQKDSIRSSIFHPKLLDRTLAFELLFILEC